MAEFYEGTEGDIYQPDFEGDFEQNIVGSYKDIERIGFGGAYEMATEIEGGGKMAQILERRLKMDPDFRLVTELKSSYQNIKEYSLMRRHELEEITNLVMTRIPHKYYKNPQMLIFGFILLKTINKDGIKTVRDLILKTNVNITESDVIRYYHLLEKFLPR